MSVKIGLVGLGFMGMVHARILKSLPNVELKAVCDIQPHRMEGRLQVVGNIDAGAKPLDLSGVRKYARFEDLIADDDLDAIDIASPTFLHAPMAIAAMKAGRHCFCEKPMARTSAQARVMVATAAQTRRVLMIGQCLRFWPEYRLLKEMIDSRRYGRCRSAHFRRTGATPLWSWDGWMPDSERSGSCALDMHIHDADLVQWLFGVPAKVSASGTVTRDGGVSHIVASYEYAKGPAVTAQGGWFEKGYPFVMSAMLDFEKATVEYSSAQSPTVAVYTAKGRETPTVPPGDAYEEELKYFAQRVLDGKKPKVSTPADSARAVALVEAEVKAVKTGRSAAVKKTT